MRAASFPSFFPNKCAGPRTRAGSQAVAPENTGRQSGGANTREIARGAKAFKKSVKEGKTDKSRGIAKCKPRMVCSKCAVRLIQIRYG
mgnify:CR=1 FL=1